MNYLDWNDGIASAFFTPASEGRRVCLFVTKELIARLGSNESANLSNFIESLRRGPKWAPGKDICGNAEAAFGDWRDKKLTYPPYIAYLGFFALAAGTDGDFANHAYYPRLRTLLGEPPVAGTYPGFGKMRALWDDLEVWSQHDQQGRLGLFQADINSRFVHVGLPIAQTILSEAERLSLPAMFAAGGLDSQERPADAVLLNLLVDHVDRFRPRTRRIVLTRSSFEEESEALLGAVAEELSGWDGSVPATSQDGEDRTFAGSARLWCEELDPVSGTVEMRLVCRTCHEYPDEGLSLEMTQRSGVYRCEEFRDGWSHALVTASGDPFDASSVDWRSGLRLRETNQNWRFYLPASSVRLFVDAARQGLSGYIEIQGLVQGTPFLLIARHEHEPLVELWGTNSCKGLRRVSVRSGLPSGWLAYLADEAINDDVVGKLFPVLSMPHTARMSFQGGLSAAPSTYFAYALPDVVVSGLGSTAELFCNDRSLGPCTDGAFRLDETLGVDARLRLEVRAGSNVLSRRSIYVEPDTTWPRQDALVWSDRFGELTLESTPRRAAGAMVCAGQCDLFSDWVASDLTFKPEPEVVDQTITNTNERSLGDSVTSSVVTFLSEAELRRLIEPWRRLVTEEQLAESESVSLRPGGRALTEGAVQYLIGSRGGPTGRNWSRAIKELTDASASEDPLVSALALGLLQLSFYKSGRADEVAGLGSRVLPHGFSRLESFMRLLANVPDCPDTRYDGIGIADISPVEDDVNLEKQLLGSSSPLRRQTE